MSPIRIIVNGAFGKMGSMACEYLGESSAFQIVAKLGRHHELENAILQHQPDVVIDLTKADCVYNNTLIYLQHQTRFVIGASGLKTSEIQYIREKCLKQKLGGIVAPNFSIGSLLAIQFAKKAAKWFDGVDIIEMHHHLKADAPSGTAIYTAEQIHEIKNQWPEMNQSPQTGREYFCNGIPVHSIRMPGILAQQQILFGQAGETLTFQHQIIDRKAYMPGLKLACEKVMEIHELVYSLERWLID